jgi:uncharacterized protein (DUF58 family)
MHPDMFSPIAISPAEASCLRGQAAAVCHHLRLALGRRTWRGAAGQWAGKGAGSSIDFQDHRPYLPGDDPRHIDWAAFARSGNYMMKLYREEVSPRLDLLIDTSASMYLDQAKRDRLLEVIYFCVESAMAIGASLMVYTLDGEKGSRVDLLPLMGGHWTPVIASGTQSPATALATVPLRSRAMRVLITDLLFPDDPRDILHPLCAREGYAVVLAPFSNAESDPEWNGNVELLDCEKGTSRRQRVTPSLLTRYREAYASHMEAWRLQSRRFKASIARIPASGTLADALRTDALAQGVVEVWT